METGTGLLAPLTLGWHTSGAETTRVSETGVRGPRCVPARSGVCRARGSAAPGVPWPCFGKAMAPASSPLLAGSAPDPGEPARGRWHPARPRPLALPCPAERRIFIFFSISKQTN